jgi:hypothetical protein
MAGFLRFTIRDILWLTVVVALIAGWALDHWRLSRPVGNVGGLVTVKGQPLADGWIRFEGASEAFAAKVETDGEFYIPFISSGDYSVVIEGQNVPLRYNSAVSSPMKASIREGQNTIHFELP